MEADQNDQVDTTWELIFSLPSTRKTKLATFAINTTLLLFAADFAFYPSLDTASDVVFTRIGAVYPDAAKVVVFIVTSVPFTSLWTHEAVTDSWAGFTHEKATILSALHTVPNVIMLSGDRHEFAAVQFWAPRFGATESSSSKKTTHGRASRARWNTRRTITEDTRCAYPIEFIPNAQTPCSVDGRPKNIIMLTCDAFGVLPPLPLPGRLHFVSLMSTPDLGAYPSRARRKTPGTEDGVLEPIPTFCTCHSAPFIVLSPGRHAEMLAVRISRHHVSCWLINAGWTGGKYGQGKRCPLKCTRRIVDAVHSGKLLDASYETFDLIAVQYFIFSDVAPSRTEEDPRDTLRWVTSKADKEERAPASLRDVLAALDGHLAGLHSALPPRTAFIAFSGHSDPRRMSALNAKKNAFETALRAGRTGEEVDSEIIGGPNKPKHINSFLFPALCHVAALGKEGLRIWDTAENRTFTSKIFVAPGELLIDEELDAVLPSQGYSIVTPPPGYAPLIAPRKLMVTPISEVRGFQIQDSSDAAAAAAAGGLAPELPTGIPDVGNLAFFKAEDAQYLSKAAGLAHMISTMRPDIDHADEYVRNTTAQVRGFQIQDSSDAAAAAAAGGLAPELPTGIPDVGNLAFFKAEDAQYLSKAAGLAHMISTMRPDIDHADEYVRNTTARAFSVVASALRIPSPLPFLKAIAVMMGCAVLPHLRNLVDCIEHGLADERQKVRTMTALGLAALAEAAAPYCIESFDNVLEPLWMGIRLRRGKGLAAFLKAIGFIIPLMDPEYASYYTKEVTVILIREFRTSDEEMKKIVLKVVKQRAATEGVTPQYIKQDSLPGFFKAFWKAGASEIMGRIVNELKDEAEPYRKMVMETITKVVASLGATDVDEKLEVRLVDGDIYSFQEQTTEDQVMLDGFGTVVTLTPSEMNPPVKDFLPRMTPILRNRHEKGQGASINLIGLIADRGAEFVPAREWMRICEEALVPLYPDLSELGEGQNVYYSLYTSSSKSNFAGRNWRLSAVVSVATEVASSDSLLFGHSRSAAPSLLDGAVVADVGSEEGEGEEPLPVSHTIPWE
ncbi:hypothetical protein BV25DRAFT_1917618 [Artomyces pyxidatus]|uniref:Uncharacterized protein n=1 Tax=Artomyces pyxidatus TaxID=48021 RepID=A0ACB8SWL0_9AGAM|nr:hypothetical protein BV25DRAFT_1917618 [Artomyces pyxidatus]